MSKSIRLSDELFEDGLPLIHLPVLRTVAGDFAGYRPSFTRSSAESPHQHSTSVRSLTKLDDVTTFGSD